MEQTLVIVIIAIFQRRQASGSLLADVRVSATACRPITMVVLLVQEIVRLCFSAHLLSCWRYLFEVENKGPQKLPPR